MHLHFRVCSLVISLLHTKKNAALESPRYFLSSIAAAHKPQPGWRRVIGRAVLWGIPTPACSTALAFFDGYRSEVVPANLLQAQVCVALQSHR
ncbi:hypothetical protein BU15DRAFT_42724 [Melanogaster broomeanus]|nr:hypothetical protein BU15DRAFT_42724 [Melanogaster broomeanus]